jgi:hypothetical protein
MSEISGIMCGVPQEGVRAVATTKRLAGERGVAMTEFALVLPMFMLIVAGLLAFGRVLFYWIETNHLANETARWAAVDRRPDPSKTLQVYARDSGGTVEFSDAKVCIGTPDGSNPTIGGPIQVKISKPFSFVPILQIAPIKIRGEATMRIERFANGTTPSYSYSTSASPLAGAPFGACT